MGSPNTAGAQNSGPIRLPARKRTLILDQEVDGYVRRGYRILSQTPFSAQLLRPKRFSCLFATLGLLAVGIGFLVYLAIFLSLPEIQVFLRVDDQGSVQRVVRGPRPTENFLTALLWIGGLLILGALVLGLLNSAREFRDGLHFDLPLRPTATLIDVPPGGGASKQPVVLDVRTWAQRSPAELRGVFGAPDAEAEVPPGGLTSVAGTYRHYPTWWGSLETVFVADRAQAFLLRFSRESAPRSFGDGLQALNLPGSQAPDARTVNSRLWNRLVGFTVEIVLDSMNGGYVSQMSALTVD